MADPAERGRRRKMLGAPHVAPLTVYVNGLRQQQRGEVPDFDPLDGGINARILFLFEKPGPMTSAYREGRRLGSGFISRDNDDPTAAATSSFMQQAGICRNKTVLWNAIPWWNGDRKVTTKELTDGVEELQNLLKYLRQLRVIVLVGKNAERARVNLPSQVKQVSSAHPSPLVRARYNKRWKEIPKVWERASKLAD